MARDAGVPHPAAAARLRDATPGSSAGVARLSRLLTDGYSQLYLGRPGPPLRRHVDDPVDWLDHGPR